MDNYEMIGLGLIFLNNVMLLANNVLLIVSFKRPESE